MDTNKIMFLVSVLSTFMLIAYVWHIYRNPELHSQNKNFLIISASLLIATHIFEDIALFINGKPGIGTGYYILLIIESVLSMWIVPTQVSGFDFREEGKIISRIVAVFSLLVIALAPWGLFFSVSPDGFYIKGKLYVLLQALQIILLIVYSLMLFGLSRRFEKKGSPMLLMTGILYITGTGFSLISGYELIQYISFSMSFMLVYSYYENLSILQAAEDLRTSKKRNEELALQMIQVIVNAVDAKDPYTNGHSKRVSEYAVLLAENLGWDEQRLYELKYEALMHDVGKIGVPDSVLNKQGRLSESEFKIIQSHTIFGSDILKIMDIVPGAYLAARWHHERYDGRGYPDGKKGSELPENARIISIADTFDAMNSDRIYRRALPKDAILRELEKGKNTQFDPYLAELFINLVKKGATDEIAASGRKDLVAADPIREELRDLFEMFNVANDMSGWDDDYKNTERMRKYLLDMANRNKTDIEIAVVRVNPKTDLILTEEEFDAALSVMITALENSVPELLACGRITKTQIVAIHKVAQGPDLSQFIQLAFVYYYKIYKADSVDISFDILDK